MVQMVRLREAEALAAEKDKDNPGTVQEVYTVLIEFGPQGDYYISSKLRKLFTDTRDA